jgi:hypothetical protein
MAKTSRLEFAIRCKRVFNISAMRASRYSILVSCLQAVKPVAIKSPDYSEVC